MMVVIKDKWFSFDYRLLLVSVVILCNFTDLVLCRRHHLVLEHDSRLFFPVSSFGYLIGGQLFVDVKNLTLDYETTTPPEMGFTLIRSNHLAYPFQDDDRLRRPCYLDKLKNSFSPDIVTMSINFEEKKVLMKCHKNLNNLKFFIPSTKHSARIHHHIEPRAAALPNQQYGKMNSNVSESSGVAIVADIQPSGLNSTGSSSLAPVYPPAELTYPEPENSLDKNNPSDEDPPELRNPQSNSYDTRCNLDYIPMTVKLDARERTSVSFNFSMLITDSTQEGVYFLTFHNCRPDRFRTRKPIDLDVIVYETNFQDNYLSAGHMPLPQLYFALSVLFFLVGMIWMNFMWQQRDSALKIHYLMTMLIFAKTSSLFFHAINYHYISRDGYPVETWAYLFYASRLLKGALFFITIILIGSGWTFIKHMLSDKDKKIVLIIVPLQLLANVAAIVFDESVEGELKHSFWKEIFVLIDLACCGAILFPIVWSVRHLQEASHTDGKAAINLRKLELFRHFYIMIVGYIYFTRIITYLLQAVLSFRYFWLTVVLSEVATLVFFVVTGYFFQPIPTNPYLLLSQDEDLELEEDVLFSVGPAPSAFAKPYTKSSDGQSIPDSQRLIKRDLDDPEL